MTVTDEQAPAVETADEWAAKIAKFTNRKPHEQPVTFPDPDAQAELDIAMQAVMDARRAARRRWQEQSEAPTEEDLLPLDEYIDADSEVVASREKAENAAVAADKAATTFLFRALPPGVYDALGLQHPPTDEQAALGHRINIDTYTPELISLCSAKPLSVIQVRMLIEARVSETGEQIPPALNAGEVNVMVAACRAVNEDTDFTLGKGSRPTLI